MKAVLLQVPVDDVIGGGAGRAQVHRQHGKLQGSAALQEHDLVVGGNAKQLAQVGFGGLDDGLELLGAVADLHHGHAGAFEIQHLGLSLLKNFERQGGGAGVEVEDTLDIGH